MIEVYKVAVPIVCCSWFLNVLIISSFNGEWGLMISMVELLVFVVAIACYIAGRKDGAHVEEQAPPA